jgi:opacity protein-like surface antigen
MLGPMKSSERRPGAVAAALALTCWTAAAAGQAPLYDRVGRPSLDAGIGVFEAQSSSHLENQDGQGVGAVGLGYRASQRFAWGVEITGFSQRVDTPEGVQASRFTRVDGRSRLSGEGLALSLRYIAPMGRWEPYAGGGLGWYRSRLEVRGSSFFFRDTLAEERSNDFGAHLLAGVDYWVRPRIALGAELRYLRLNAKFDELVPGTVHVGGTFLMFRYRQGF